MNALAVAIMASLTFTPPPTLARFMRSDAFVRAVVGPVGSGKTSACVMEFLHRAVRQAPGSDGVRRSRWAAIRNTYGQLRDTTRKTFEQWVPASWGHWREQEFTFVLSGPLADGTRIEAEVLFRALDRPEDVRKLLSLELTGAYINEMREVPKHVVDVLQARVGRYPSKTQGAATWFGVWGDTNPWPIGHWGYRLFSEERPEGFAVYGQPSGLGPTAENIENLPPGYYERLCAGKDSEWVDEYVRGLYPKADRGSVYGHLIAALKARGGLAEFDHPGDGVFTSWDLGISDSTAIWFWRLGAGGIDVVDHYESHGQAISHYFAVLDAKPYGYVKHWLPHDARARTLATGRTLQDEFNRKFGAGRVSIGPDLTVVDGIAAARALLEHPNTRIHPRCSSVNGPGDIDGVDALREYRYEYDEDAKVYSKRPLHNWASHSADALRYLACVVDVSELLMRKPDETAKVRAPPTGADVTLDELWDISDADSAGRRERI